MYLVKVFNPAVEAEINNNIRGSTTSGCNTCKKKTNKEIKPTTVCHK